MQAKKARKSVVKCPSKEMSRRDKRISQLQADLERVKLILTHSEREKEVQFFQLVQAMQVACVMSVPFLENRSMEQTLEFFEHIAKTMGYDPAELRPALRMVLLRGRQQVIEMQTEPIDGWVLGTTVNRRETERAFKSPRLRSFI